MGASGGVGLAALKNTLAAGYQCIALCRTPSTLTDVLPTESNPNLRVLQGNAHDVTSVSQLIRKEDGSFVDTIVSTIGTKPTLSMKMFDDMATVCQKGMSTLLEAIEQLRQAGASGKPHIIVCGTTGMSRFGRDIPLAQVPLYKVLLATPHADKTVMEDKLTESGEEFTVVRCGWLLNGEKDRPIRVGIEDPKKGIEVQEIGYAISREDAGKWFAEQLIIKKDYKYLNKVASIVY
ncbi:hypothetical protein N0V82_000972 [Gnomoniopsis sp. IMI 355080]|nr:hypothetical protein N0V82_000972 [Gnomoniopsis sp. IMI 355080]